MGKDKPRNEEHHYGFTSDRASSSLRIRVATALVIFAVAFGVRLLSWHDTRLEVAKVQTVVSGDYKRVAQLLKQGGFASFLSSSSALSDLNTLGHPPGYSILIALIYSFFGESDTAIQFVQIACDSLAAVVIFLIVSELLPGSAAAIAGLLAAFSPQFAWNSVLLLPDSISVLPILLSVYCIARARRHPRLVTMILAGALVGISCWLRANAILLTIFLAGATLLLFESERRWRYVAAVVCGTLLIVAPLTIRNAIVFHRFIPVSMGAGQTLLEGIADYDAEGRFGIPGTDMGIMKQEAELFNRPEYYGTLSSPDGVERERGRLARGLAVIRAHPFWFSGVMARRAASMLRLERSRLTSKDPPVSHTLDASRNTEPVWTNTPAELLANSSLLAPRARSFLQPDGQTLTLTGDDSKYGEQFVSPAVSVQRNTDYVLTIPIKVDRGRMKISVTNAKGKVYASTVVETLEGMPAALEVHLPFVAESEPIRIVFSNEASNPANPISQIATIKLFQLGVAANLWTRYPRFLVHEVQRVFLTAFILPLAIIGLVALAVSRRWPALIILLAVPAYYFCVQSIMHTEYRYVLPVTYSVFALAAAAISRILNLVIATTPFFRSAPVRSNH